MFHTVNNEELAGEVVKVRVVIPWRGFRCFTPKATSGKVGEIAKIVGCNPLAGI